MLDMEKINCTGCGACFNICPHGAIKMVENTEGFLYPQIEETSCVKCGLCTKVCPSLHPIYQNENNPQCFAAMASDDLRADSTSGAVFPLLAEDVLKNGGYVCGAAYSEDMLSVEHIIVENVEELRKLKGSKYLQSNTKNCYRQIKKLLSEGKKILFSGTPCQVAGLKGFLQKNYDNLLCVDIICHGTPSPKVYRKYIEELGLAGKLTQVNFRDKRHGWGGDNFVNIVSEQKSYLKSAKNDAYMKAFLQNYCLRESCGDCPFNKMPRQGDLTIGDFWGVTAYKKSYNDKKGTSVILVNSDKGRNALEKIKNRFKLLKKVDLKYAVGGNRTLVSSSPINNTARKTFFANLDEMSLKENVELCEHTKISTSSLSLEIPSPNIISNSAVLNGGATLFLTILTFVCEPINSPLVPLSDSVLRTSIRILA